MGTTMSDADRRRLKHLEQVSDEFAARLSRLEAQMARGVAVPSVAPPPVPFIADVPQAPVATTDLRGGHEHRDTVAAPSAAFRRPQRPSFEDVLAGRVLAWAGATAVLVGVVLFFAIAISRGWIGEGTRTLLGTCASSLLVAAGCWLHERRGRTEASLAATAAGLGGLFITTTVAARVYELIPTGVGVLLGLGIGALSTALALRWRNEGIAALGIVGGLLAPVLVDAPHDGGTIAILFPAALAAAAVCVRERWDWLGLAALATVTPQWIGYLSGGPSPLATLATLVAFGMVAAGGAVGFELREPSRAVRPVSVLLLTVNGFVLAVVGWVALDQSNWWLGGLAAAHVAIGVGLLRNARASRPVGILAAALGAVLADLALLQLLDGPALTVSWAALTLGFAGLVRYARAHGDDRDDAAAGAGLAAHVALALSSSVMTDASPGAVVAGGVLNLAAASSLAIAAAACLTAGFVLADRLVWRFWLNGVGLAATAYLLASQLDGMWLVAAWAAEAVALAALARRTQDWLALIAAVTHVALASAHALSMEAPPRALLDGLADPVAATVALGACMAAAWRCAAVAAALPPAAVPSDAAIKQPDVAEDQDSAQALSVLGATAGALLALHLVSAQLVTLAGAGPRAQVLLSALWGAIGVAALVGGLVRDVAPLRTGALWLLLTALAKVFLYDLSALTSIARVASFIVLGLLLLLSAFAWQRIRPRPLPDLRQAPADARI